MPKVTILGYQVSHSLNGKRYIDVRREMCIEISPERLESYRKHLQKYFMERFPNQGVAEIYFVTIETTKTKVSYSEIIENNMTVSLSEN